MLFAAQNDEAMKQKEFRDHIDEYTREVSDPAHRQEYLDYLSQIEACAAVEKAVFYGFLFAFG